MTSHCQTTLMSSNFRRVSGSTRAACSRAQSMTEWTRYHVTPRTGPDTCVERRHVPPYSPCPHLPYRPSRPLGCLVWGPVTLTSTAGSSSPSCSSPSTWCTGWSTWVLPASLWMTLCTSTTLTSEAEEWGQTCQADKWVLMLGVIDTFT